MIWPRPHTSVSKPLPPPHPTHLYALIVRALPVAVQVKVLEGGLQMVLPLQLALVDRGGKELLVVNSAVTVNVCILHAVYVWGGQGL